MEPPIQVPKWRSGCVGAACTCGTGYMHTEMQDYRLQGAHRQQAGRRARLELHQPAARLQLLQTPLRTGRRGDDGTGRG